MPKTPDEIKKGLACAKNCSDNIDGCKEFGEHWIEDGVIVCGMFEWRGVQKEDT